MSKSGFNWLWCLLFHRKHWKRTGERRIMRASIVYECICSKCGQEQEERNWTISWG